MNRDNEHLSNTDPDVSTAYRAIANESVPERLDSIVLRQAATRWQLLSKLVTGFESYRRPLAFAAVFVLALSMVLQFNDALVSTTPIPPDGLAEPGESATNTGEISALVDASTDHFQQQSRQGENVISQGYLNKPMPLAVGGAEAMRPEDIRFCDVEQTASAELWWACIVDLDRNGRPDDSARERELLINTYPDFLPPK
jgi:hypothetical protein